MEFWGVEVKPGQTVKCDIEEGKLLHLQQAALGESKKGVESVSIFVKFNDQKLVVGTLSQEKLAQIQYDLVFEKEFDLSHSSKNASVYFCGYKTASQDDSPSGKEDFSGKFVKKEQAKMKAKDGVDDEVKTILDSTVEKKATHKKATLIRKVPIEFASKKTDFDKMDDGTLKMISTIFGYTANAHHVDDDEDGVDDEYFQINAIFERIAAEEEEAKKAAVSGKKRPIESASKVMATEKKAKLISPDGQKTGGNRRKGALTATPHPAKTGKTSANNDKSKQQTPKSSGSATCKSFSKSFNSDNALQAHTKAKHSATK